MPLVGEGRKSAAGEDEEEDNEDRPSSDEDGEERIGVGAEESENSMGSLDETGLAVG